MSGWGGKERRKQDLDHAEVGPADLEHQPGSVGSGVRVYEVDSFCRVGDQGNRWAANAVAGGEEAAVSADREAMAR